MRRAWLSFGFLMAACTDYAVHVDFDIPADYKDDIESVSLAVIVPPPAMLFDCEQLAFGEISPLTVQLATIQEINTTRDDDSVTPLAGIPRLGNKLFYAQGLDAQDLPLVAGCAEHGDIDGVVNVTIPGEPTAVLSMNEKDPGEPLPERVGVLVVDARGQPLSGAEVRFTVFGPGVGEPSSGAATTGDDGKVNLQPVAPALPGPQALDVQVRWNRVTPDSLLGFGAPPILFTTALPGNPDDPASNAVEGLYVVGRIGPAGEPGFAALGKVDMIGGGRQVLLAWYDAGEDPPFATVTSPVLNGALALGLIRGPGDDRDRVFTINGAQWIEFETDGDLASSLAPDPGRPATRIVAADDCAAAAGDRVLVSYTDDSLAVYDANHDPVASPLDDGLPGGARIVASGCVSATTDTALQRTVAYSSGGALLHIRTELDGGRQGELPALAQGVGFAPALGGGEAHLLAAEVDVDGVRLARWRLAPLAVDTVDLEKVTEDGSTVPPLSTQGGDVDGDGQVDVVALLGFGERDAATLSRVRVTLEVDHLGERLSGISAAESLTRPRLFLYDFDGDGIDDALIASPDQARVWKTGPLD